MAKAIMIQGTMSNAGKSLLAAGLCRVFKQDGYRVAPFKSQNMALNSFITEEGLEMGRAQVMQAEAAGIAPSVLMNPILLKPTSDVGSQVIVNGEVRGNMRARDYFKYKKSLIPDIMSAYTRLSEDYDIIVIEGAGSPAEINLKSEDIVNMGMAKMVDAPVLLVGDIDRGGVFAQLVGTMMLLEEEEKARVKGLVINKFRGDKTILDPGIEMMKAYTPVPVVGVVPYMQLDVDDEDSLSTRLGTSKAEKGHGLVDIAVVRLPRISNFTDFNALERIPGVDLRYVDKADQLGEPDLILLPGTKNTMGDLKWLRSGGMEAAILKKAAAGTLIMGICGGYQMLGAMISDPEHTEEGGTMAGMGLLPEETLFEGEKIRTRVQGICGKLRGDWEDLAGVPFEGYEIHMGRSRRISFAGSETFAEIETLEGQKSADGLACANVCGSYVHGIFDSPQMQKALIGLLMKRKGLENANLTWIDDQAYKNQQYDLLAKGVRESMDMAAIYQMMGLAGPKES